MKRIKICTWYHDQQLRIHHPSGVEKTVIRYIPSIDHEYLPWCDRRKEELELERAESIATIALYAGSYSRLWVGPWDGVITPMDVQPKGWAYPNGSLLEPSWWWQWHPSDAAKNLIVRDLSRLNPLGVEIFKCLVPAELQRRSGTISDVQAIDLIRLPELIENGTPYIFETEL